MTPKQNQTEVEEPAKTESGDIKIDPTRGRTCDECLSEWVKRHEDSKPDFETTLEHAMEVMKAHFKEACLSIKAKGYQDVSLKLECDFWIHFSEPKFYFSAYAANFGHVEGETIQEAVAKIPAFDPQSRISELRAELAKLEKGEV